MSISGLFYLVIYGNVTYVCRMKEENKRKEVHLDSRIIERLQQLADKKCWSLKQYMEVTLSKHAANSIKSKSQPNTKTK